MANIPIFLSSDDNYAPFVATTIASICDNTQSFCEFYILDGGISAENKEKICKFKKQFNNFSIEFIKIDIEKELSSISYKNECPHVSISTYNRFLIPKLKPELKKILYLDVDIIAIGNVKELFDIDLGVYSLGAISEINTNFQNAQERSLALRLDKHHQYFNAGILLIDNEKWIKNDILDKLFKVEKNYRELLMWADQDILNIVFNNNYLKLPEKFNFMTGKQEIDEKIIIRHFNTNIKPWDYHPDLNITTIKHHNEFWEYAKITSFYEELIKNCKFKSQVQLRVLSLIQNRNLEKTK